MSKVSELRSARNELAKHQQWLQSNVERIQRAAKEGCPHSTKLVRVFLLHKQVNTMDTLKTLANTLRDYRKAVEGGRLVLPNKMIVVPVNTAGERNTNKREPKYEAQKISGRTSGIGGTDQTSGSEA